MKKTLLFFSLALSISLTAQKKVDQSVSRENTTIPFICNKQIDNYLSDYQSFVELLHFVTKNGDDKLKQKVSEKYMQLIQKYSNINQVISQLKPNQQRDIAQFIKEKTDRITQLTRSKNTGNNH